MLESKLICSMTLAAYDSHGQFRLFTAVCTTPWLSVCTTVGRMQHPGVCVCEQVVGETYRDDIQDAEEAVDTISGVNLLHHALFAILGTRNNT